MSVLEKYKDSNYSGMLLLLAANVFCQVMWGHTNASRTSGGRFRGSVPLNELRSVH